MTIQRTFNSELGLYIPYYEGGGIHTEFCSYLICRKDFRSRLGKDLKPINTTTQNLIYYRVKLLLDHFEENDIHFTDATYEYDIENFKELIREEWEWSEESLRLYIGSWRQFYEFLTIDGVLHSMHFPPKGETKHRIDLDDQFLSHTIDDPYENVKTETAIDVKRLTHRDDYSDKVLSMSEYWQLYNKLYEDDPVFAVMASTMMQTFLRIGGIMQFPLAPTVGNKNWQRFEQMKRKNMKSQTLHYKKKGGDPESLTVHIHTMEIIDKFYLKPLYQERKALFQTKYAQSVHAKKKGINVNSQFTWLNKHGTPVDSDMLQEAFRKASEALGFKAIPHFCRHTGATQMLWRYCKANNIEIHEGMAGDIHAWLKKQLGHVLLSTTRYYVNTVYRMKASAVVMYMLPGQMKELDTAISEDAAAAYKQAMVDHEEYMRGRIVA
jgi:site-specific recombinase XerC